MNLTCPDCGSEMILRTGPFTLPDGTKRKFYGCSRYPDCTCAHGAHPDGRPLGKPANKETRQMRIKAHEVFDSLWHCTQITMTRKKAYALLAEKLGVKEVHIGESDIPTCEKIIEVSMQLIKELRHETKD